MKTCLWCGKSFKIHRKRVALCEGCREVKKDEQDRRRQQEKREDERALLNNVLPLVPKELHSRAYELVRQYVNARTVPEKGLPKALRMPSGYASQRGPWEGSSTYFDEIAEAANKRTNKSHKHDWWKDNSAEDVFFELGKIENARAYFESLAEERAREGTACREAKGEHRGYQRHIQVGEDACKACLRAKAEYISQWRLRDTA